MTNERANQLREMDDYIRENIQDEEIVVNLWLVYMPDEATDEDLLEIATDDDEECFNDILDAFARCILLDSKN